MRSVSFMSLHASVAAASLFTPPTSLSKRDKQCYCYLTNGSQPEYFSGHSFFDFRSLASHAAVPDAPTTYMASREAPVANDYFMGDDWTSMWSVQHWNNSASLKKSASTEDPKITMSNSFSNVYIEENQDEDADSKTYLTMRTKRLKSFQTAAEFESVDTYHYVSARMLARTVGSPGAVTALFTYRDGGSLSKVQEADIEVLTRGPRDHISYTNQPSYTEDGDDIDKATRNATLPDGKEWSQWLVHRLDWTPTASIWYVDGVEVAKIEFQTPRDPSLVVLNAWSDGGDWSGEMAVNDEAYMQIKWIEMVYNRTEEGGAADRKVRRDVGLGPNGHLVRRDEEGSCGVVCSIDEATQVGEAVQIQDNASPRPKISWLTSSMILAIFAASFLR